MTQNTTDETMAFFRAQHGSGSTAWYRKCLMLQRSARGLPARYPTAATAADETPESDRVYDLDKVARGMVMYFEGTDPAGHITGVAGRNPGGYILDWTNDAKRTGGVDLVRSTFFSQHWGQKFMFAATSLNGYDLDLPSAPAPAKKPPKDTRGKDVLDGVEAGYEAAIKLHTARHHPALVRELTHELAVFRQTRKERGK